MVKARMRLFKKAFSLIVLPLFFAACSLPSYYNDFDSRFAWHDIFHFLKAEDRNPDVGDPYSFLVVSDLHITTWQEAEHFAKIKERLNGAKFVVITGDCTQEGTRAELENFTGACAVIGVPCYPVAGNHDIYDNRGAPWKEVIGSTTYRIDSTDGLTSLIILDNANGSFGYEQLEWLEDQMNSYRQNTFVFAHDNFFITSSPPDAEQITSIQERARVMALLRNRCDIMFMGHLHKRIEKEYGGVKYVMSDVFGENGVFCRVTVDHGVVSYSFEKL